MTPVSAELGALLAATLADLEKRTKGLRRSLAHNTPVALELVAADVEALRALVSCMGVYVQNALELS